MDLNREAPFVAQHESQTEHTHAGVWTTRLLVAALVVAYLWRGGVVAGSRTAILIFVAAGIYAWFRESRLRGPAGPRWLGVSVLLPGSVALLACIWSVRPPASLQAAMVWLAVGAVYWLALAAAGSDPARLLRTQLTWATVAGGLALLLFVVSPPINPRARGTLDYDNALGLLMLVTFILLCTRMLAQPRLRPGHAALGVLLATTLWLAMSRGTLYLMPVAFLVMLLLLPALSRGRAAGYLVGFMAAGYAGAWGVGWFRATVTLPGNWVWTNFAATSELMAISTSSYSWVGRIELWTTAVRMFLARPWGWGPATFGAVYPQFQVDDSIIYSVTPHSLYVQALVEQGLLGLLALAAVGIAFAVLTVRSMQKLPPDRRTLAAGLATAVLAMMMHGAFDLTWDIPAVSLTAAFLLGLLAAVVGVGAPAQTRRPGLILGTVALLVLLGVARPLAVEDAIRKGNQLMSAGDLQSARAAFTRAAVLDPFLAEPLAGRAATAYAAATQGDRSALKPALADVDSAIRRDPLDVQLYLQRARYLFASGDNDGAEQSLNNGLAISRFDPALRVSLAQLEAADGRFRESRIRLTELLQSEERIQFYFSRAYLDRWITEGRLTLATLEIQGQRWAEAATHLEEVLKVDPESARAQSLLNSVRPHLLR